MKVEKSLPMMAAGIFLFFSAAITVTLWAPRHVDSTWVTPSSYFQKQMYEESDPHFYISGGSTLQYVHHLQKGQTLIAFEENKTTRIVAPEKLKKYITHIDDKDLKLTSSVLLLREPEGEFVAAAKNVQESIPDLKPKVYELYDPEMDEAFSYAISEGVYDDFIDKNFTILDPVADFHSDPGVVFVKNPREYRVTYAKESWTYSPNGERIENLSELKGPALGFRSRKELIDLGERIYREEGCFYCHTDQTRTLVQDVVLNGTESYPAPPSSPSEYMYQNVTMPGTRRIGPDLSRVAIKRPGRDWHKSHFWSPKTESPGSIMPSFRHFFDFDPRGTSHSDIGVPNAQFEALYQYLMTKGNRITPPTQAWWLGKDPTQTLRIIEWKKTPEQ